MNAACSRVIRRLTAAAVVLAVSGAASGLSAGVSNADPSPTPMPIPEPTPVPIALTVTPGSPADANTTETLTATVGVAGSVQFTDGDTPLGAAVPVTGAVATTITRLPPGRHTLTAKFIHADSPFGSSSAVVSYLVNAHRATPTATSLTTSAAGPGDPGTPVTLTTAVSPTAAGSVQFWDGNTAIGIPATVANGAASTTTSPLTVGSHRLTAKFTPTDATAFTPSTSSEVAYVVKAATGATATTITLRVVPNRAFQGFPVIFLTNVAPFGASGTIQVMDGTAQLGVPVGVTAGYALSIMTLPAGMHSLTAVFTPTNQEAGGCSTPGSRPGAQPFTCPTPGDPATFAPSTSAPASLTVESIFTRLGF